MILKCDGCGQEFDRYGSQAEMLKPCPKCGCFIVWSCIIGHPDWSSTRWLKIDMRDHNTVLDESPKSPAPGWRPIL